MIEKNALLFPSGLPDQAPLISVRDHLGSIALSPFLYAFYLPKNAIHSASATAPYGAVAEKDKKLFGLGNTVGFHILCVDILDLLQAGGHGGNDGKHQNDHVDHSADNEEVVVAPCKLDHNGEPAWHRQRRSWKTS